MIYEYTYVNIEKEDTLFGYGGFSEHRTYIDAYAKKGYRFVGAIPTKASGYGAATRLDLIFERPAGQAEAGEDSHVSD